MKNRDDHDNNERYANASATITTAAPTTTSLKATSSPIEA
jgi:hypothetical protein